MRNERQKRGKKRKRRRRQKKNAFAKKRSVGPKRCPRLWKVRPQLSKTDQGLQRSLQFSTRYPKLSQYPQTYQALYHWSLRKYLQLSQFRHHPRYPEEQSPRQWWMQIMPKLWLLAYFRHQLLTMNLPRFRTLLLLGRWTRQPPFLYLVMRHQALLRQRAKSSHLQQ